MYPSNIRVYYFVHMTIQTRHTRVFPWGKTHNLYSKPHERVSILNSKLLWFQLTQREFFPKNIEACVSILQNDNFVWTHCLLPIAMHSNKNNQLSKLLGTLVWSLDISKHHIFITQSHIITIYQSLNCVDSIDILHAFNL